MIRDLQSSDIPKRQFYRTLFRENKRLLKAILSFNAQLYADEKNIRLRDKNINDELLEYIKCSQAACKRLVGIDTFGFWDFEEESRRILLVDWDSLKKGIEYWGASFCASAIRGVIAKADHSILENQIRPELLDYAMGRGSFYLGQAKQLICVDEFDCLEQAANQVRLCGITALFMVSEGWPTALNQVIKKMITIGYEDINPDVLESCQEVNPAQQRLLWGMLKNIFLREVAPEWTPCFS